MRKAEELTNSLSCMNRAREGELVFVLLGRDCAASWAIMDRERTAKVGNDEQD